MTEESMFFFEKKNQKTFVRLFGAYPRPSEKSLFASFSSEKEDFFLARQQRQGDGKRHPALLAEGVSKENGGLFYQRAPLIKRA